MPVAFPLLCYIPLPDEKGTESYLDKIRSFMYDRGYIPLPDEKGTERFPPNTLNLFEMRVTFLYPMKRGLKVRVVGTEEVDCVGYNPCPDEKGTESIYSLRH